MAKNNKDYKLELLTPSFDSPLTDLILELNHLRKRRLEGSTNPYLFFQLKRIFHTLESIGSARIEGNNTTIAEFIENKIENEKTKNPNIIEIRNVENAMELIDNTPKEYPINKTFVSQLHQKVVENLKPAPEGEGDKTPGEYRKSNVKINNVEHTPPDYIHVNDLMNELFEFINSETAPKYDLLKTAIAHHRFVWIHPFTNGNGRTVRLFTYAMLVKQGFNIAHGRIINPTAIFCSDRDKYYENLAKADTGIPEEILYWSEYVLSGLKNEIEKIDKLLDYPYLKKEILIPAINFSLDRESITNVESKILKKVLDCENQIMQNSDLKEIFPGKVSQYISRYIRNLVSKKMLMPINTNSKKYQINFSNNYLLRGVIDALDKKGFLPKNL
jgi:Fic family protein